MDHDIYFGKYLKYKAGGAEISTTQLILKNLNSLAILPYILFNTYSFPENYDLKICNSKKIKLINIPKLYFLDYFINKIIILIFYKNIFLNANSINVYGTLAPIFNSHKNVYYYIRCTEDYKIQISSFYKMIYVYLLICIQFPFYLLYKYDYKKLVKNSNIIANSKYISNDFCLHYKVNPKVNLPEINISSLNNVDLSNKNRIIFIGDNSRKGLGIVLNIAKANPQYNFHIYRRNYPCIIGNIHYHSWVNDYAELYNNALLVLIPSQWDEAYCRVAAEASYLGIDIIASDCGGINEAVSCFKSTNYVKLLENYKSTSEWVNAFKVYASSYIKETTLD